MMVVWMEPQMHVVMTIVGRAIHPCWIKVVFSMSYFSNFLVVASFGGGVYVIATCEFKELYFEVLVGCEWRLGHGCCAYYA